MTKKLAKKSQPKGRANKTISLKPGMWVAHDKKRKVLVCCETAEEAYQKASSLGPGVKFYLIEYLGVELEGSGAGVFGGDIDWHPEITSESSR